MRNLVIGIIIGMLVGGGVAFAATRHIILQSANGIAISASNPLPISIQ